MAALTSKRSNERKKLLEVWFKSLPQCQQDDIMAIAETLVDEIQARPVASGAGKFGIASALEVIWAVVRGQDGWGFTCPASQLQALDQEQSEGHHV